MSNYWLHRHCFICQYVMYIPRRVAAFLHVFLRRFDSRLGLHMVLLFIVCFVLDLSLSLLWIGSYVGGTGFSLLRCHFLRDIVGSGLFVCACNYCPFPCIRLGGLSPLHFELCEAVADFLHPGCNIILVLVGICVTPPGFCPFLVACS